MLFEFAGEQVPELGMCLHQSGNICKIFDTLALSSFRLRPRLHLAFESVFQRSYSQKNAVNVSGNGSRAEISIEILRAELDADFRATLKVDGPLEFLGTEPGLFKQQDGAFD